MQEIKLQASHCEEVLKELGLPDWHVTWNCSQDKKGRQVVGWLVGVNAAGRVSGSTSIR